MRDIDIRVLGAIEALPGSTAKQIVVALGGPAVGASQLRNQVYGAITRLRDLSRIEPSGWPQHWTLRPSADLDLPGQPLPDPPYCGADDPIAVQRVDVERCAHLLRAFLRLGGVGEPTRALVSRLEHALRGEPG